MKIEGEREAEHRRRRYAAHRRWMVRSFALALSAVTLRIALLVPMQLQLDFMPIYRVTSCLQFGLPSPPPLPKPLLPFG